MNNPENDRQEPSWLRKRGGCGERRGRERKREREKGMGKGKHWSESVQKHGIKYFVKRRGKIHF